METLARKGHMFYIFKISLNICSVLLLLWEGLFSQQIKKAHYNFSKGGQLYAQRQQKLLQSLLYDRVN